MASKSILQRNQVAPQQQMVIAASDPQAGSGLKDVAFTVAALLAQLSAAQAGSQIYTIQTSPSEELGNNGDYCINSLTGVLFGPKSNGLWPTTPIFLTSAAAAANAASIAAIIASASGLVVTPALGTTALPLSTLTGFKYSVLGAGATGNGVAIDAAAIEAADATAFANGKDITYFPAGTYVGDGSLALSGSNKSVWIGEGILKPGSSGRRQVSAEHLPTPWMFPANTSPDTLVNFHNATGAGSATVVAMGDSIFYIGASLVAPTDSPWMEFQNKIKDDNPGVAFNFLNYTIGGQNWQQMAAATPNGSPPSWWYENTSLTWLSYVQAAAPDLLFLYSCGNDYLGFSVTSFWSLVNATKTWTKVPSLLFALGYLPSIGSSVNTYNNPLTQEGIEAVTGYIRGFCKRYGYPYLDFARWHTRIRDGFDGTEVAVTQIIPGPGLPAFPTNVSGSGGTSSAWAFPAVANENGVFANNCTDFYVNFTVNQAVTNVSGSGPALSINLSGMAVLAGYANYTNSFTLDLSGAYIRYFWSDGVNSTLDATTTTIPVPAGAASYDISLRGNLLIVNINAGTAVYGTPNPIGVGATQICALSVVRLGGAYTPEIVGISSTQTMSINNLCVGNSSQITPNNRLYRPIVSDNELYEITTQAGGSGSYHMNAYGVQKVLRNLCITL
jgi:hypothetical protein